MTPINTVGTEVISLCCNIGDYLVSLFSYQQWNSKVGWVVIGELAMSGTF